MSFLDPARIDSAERRLVSRRAQDRLTTHPETELRTVQRQFEAVRAVYQLTSTLNGSDSIEQFCEAALHALSEAVHADRASILLFDQSGQMRFRAWRGLSDVYRRAVEGHSPWAPRETNPQPILIPNVDKEATLETFLPLFRQEGIQSLGFFPLVGKGVLLGKFMVYYNAPHTYTEDDIHICQTIAHQIAIALERTRTEDGLRQALQSLQTTKLELEEKIREFEKFEDVVVDRELKMIALERELVVLRALERSGKHPAK